MIKKTESFKAEVSEENTDRPEGFLGSASGNQNGPENAEPGERCSRRREEAENLANMTILTLVSAAATSDRLPPRMPCASKADPRPPANSPAARRSRGAWEIEIKKFVDAGHRFNLELGITIHQARSELHYGEWTAMWQSEEKPFALRQAEKLDGIGKRLGTLDPLDRACLPRSLNALCLLARLDRPILLRFIQEEVITRKTTVNDAKALLEEYNAEAKCASSPLSRKRWRSQLQKLQDIMKINGSRNDRVFAIAALRTAIEDLANEPIPSPGQTRVENLIQVNAA